MRPSETSVPAVVTATATQVSTDGASQVDVIGTPTARQNPTEPPQNPAPIQVCSPLDEHPLSELPEIVAAGYNPPAPGREERHHGVDYSYYQRGERDSILGMGIQSVLGGQVAMALNDVYPYGNVVIVETPGGELPQDLARLIGIGEGQSLYLLYAHMGEAPTVVLRDEVEACWPLGEVGGSGNADIPHLHLEARIGPDGVRLAGMDYYHTGTTEEERANYERWRTSGDFNHFDPMVLFDWVLAEGFE